MATKTSTQVKQDLDDLLLEDTVDAEPWTAVRKQRAISRAIRSTWPHFKIAKENSTAVVLVANTFKYSLSAIADLEDMGGGVAVCQALLEPQSTSLDWIPLRRVSQFRDNTTWYLYVPEDVVDNNAAKKIKIRYYARVPEFVTWAGTETIPAEFSNCVVYKAAVDLFGVFAQGGSDYNVEDMLKLIPLYNNVAAAELKNNTVFTMPIRVGVRAEAWT